MILLRKDIQPVGSGQFYTTIGKHNKHTIGARTGIEGHNLIHTIAQSICTHYSSLSGRLDIFWGSVTLKQRSEIWVAKSKVQKNIVTQKENNNFFAPCFLLSIFWTLFFRDTNRPMFSKQE